MIRTKTKTSSAGSLGNRLARLGASHGYRFEGDTVHLNAMFTVADPAAHDHTWALQLWACPAVPAQPDELSGHLVAQAQLPPIGEIADETLSFGLSAPAVPPAGAAEHVMVLALVAGQGRDFSDVQDICAYSRRERFLQPLIQGCAGYRVEGERVCLTVDGIENPRTAGTLSGALALELWALPARYQGGAFQGEPLAGVAFDPLAAQERSGPRSFDLRFTPPPAGRWQIVLMLREWTGVGFVTRDFSNFDLPFVQPPPQPAPASQPPGSEPAAAAVPVRPAPASPRQPAPKSERVEPVSINQATAKILAGVKGLPEKVAREIVKERPFRSLDELVRVKGMGAKLLAKIRSRLKL